MEGARTTRSQAGDAASAGAGWLAWRAAGAGWLAWRAASAFGLASSAQRMSPTATRRARRQRLGGARVALSVAAAVAMSCVLSGCLMGSTQHPRRTESVDPPPEPAPGSAQRVLQGEPPAKADSPAPPPACAGARRVPAGYTFTGTEYRWQPASWRCPEPWER